MSGSGARLAFMRRLISALEYLDLHRVSSSPLMTAACRPWPQVLPQERPLRRDHQGTSTTLSPPSSLFSRPTLTSVSLLVDSPLPQTLTLRAPASASLPACHPYRASACTRAAWWCGLWAGLSSGQSATATGRARHCRWPSWPWPCRPPL